MYVLKNNYSTFGCSVDEVIAILDTPDKTTAELYLEQLKEDFYSHMMKVCEERHQYYEKRESTLKPTELSALYFKYTSKLADFHVELREKYQFLTEDDSYYYDIDYETHETSCNIHVSFMEPVKVELK